MDTIPNEGTNVWENEKMEPQGRSSFLEKGLRLDLPFCGERSYKSYKGHIHTTVFFYNFLVSGL